MKFSVLITSFFLISCSQLSLRVERNLASDHSKSCFSLAQELISYTFPAQRTRLRNLHNHSFTIHSAFKENQIASLEGFSELDQTLTKLNVQEMEGVNRGDGVPYATHPIKLSTLAREILGTDSDEAKRTFHYTMVHDILEEGRGVNHEGISFLEKKLKDHKHISDAAYILVEPDLSSLPLPTEVKESMIEVVGYYRQITFFAHQRKDRALLNASIVDKLFNLFDRYDAVQSGKVVEEEFILRMKWRLAKQGYLLSKMEEFAHPDLTRYARSFHDNLTREIGSTSEEIQELIVEFDRLDQLYGEEIQQIILRNSEDFSML
ncbi:MAG: hypothetical protein VXV96_17170 [Bdellovibrionota bacterium]|nr:hypothetical protein [Bdellovibrionota bacterium]